MCLIPGTRTFFLCRSCSLTLPGFCWILGACHVPSCCTTTRGIFGQHLEDTVQHEKKYGKHLAPLLVEQCVDFIRHHGLTEEGLFRLPGQANLVKDLQDSFDCGEKPLFDSHTDVHTVASLLKLYLRELPEPVIPFARYEDFLSCGQLLFKDEGEGIQELAKYVKSLPQVNYNLLKYICKFLDEVQSHASHNKMSVQNLATVFGPNILRPQVEDPITIMEGTCLVRHLMSILISEHRQIFACDWCPHDTVHWTPKDAKAETPRYLDWLSEASANFASKGSCKPLPTSLSDKDRAVPTPTCSFQQEGPEALRCKFNSSLLDRHSLTSSDNWRVNELYSPQSPCLSSAEAWLKDSTFPRRLSTYDNVLPSGLSQITWSASSSGSSFPGDSANSCAGCRTSDCSALDSLQIECFTHSFLTQREYCLETGKGSSEGLCGKGCDLNHHMVASRDPACCTGALQSLVGELKAEMTKQQAEHESSMKRIEEMNTKLRKRVARLEEELDQEKKKCIVLEIKLRNSERAQEDAHKRNHLLQEEMEDFFNTLGSLTTPNQEDRILM